MPEAVRVDFYVLETADAEARLHFACRLAEKVYRLGQRVHLHAGSQAEAVRLDELLWTFRQGSFVPHELAAEGTTPGSPVTIGHGGSEPPPAGLLVNLGSGEPGFATRYARVAEIIDASPGVREQGRERFRSYRQQGCEITTHTIGAQG